MTRRLRATGLLAASLATLLLAPTSARATDGVREISQVCAVVTGCFPGDAAGFPVVLVEAGSYRLTSNLSVPDENTSAISIRDHGTTVDLNGFTIQGPTTCSGDGTGCAPLGGGVGIAGNDGGSHQETTVRNGVIRGMGAIAIFCDRGCTVENVRLESNGDSGIVLSNGPGILRRNVIRNNAGDGIFAIGVMTENVVERNGGTGIFDRGSSTVSTNTIHDNRGNGLRCNNCVAVDNDIRNNDGFGADVFGDSAFGRNVIDDNAGGTIQLNFTTLFQVDANVCDGSLVCP